MAVLRFVTFVLAAVVFLTGCGSSGGEDTMASPEQAVIVHLTTPVVDDVFALEDRLEQKISDAGVGEYDGNDIATDGSEAILYAYGPDADALWAVMEPAIRGTSPSAGSYVIKRYGEAGDPSAKEVRIAL